MAKEKYHKCNYKRGFCPSLCSCLNESNARQKGMCPVHIANVYFPDLHCIGVAYKTNSKDNGVLINNCPFCGESLKPWLDEYEKVREAREAQRLKETENVNED